MPALLVLGSAFDRVEPRLAPLDPKLGFGDELERSVVERAQVDLDGGVFDDPDAGAARGAEAVAVEGRELALDFKRLTRPVTVDRERAPGTLAAVGAVAAADVHRLTVDPVVDCTAEATARAHMVESMHASAWLAFGA